MKHKRQDVNIRMKSGGKINRMVLCVILLWHCVLLTLSFAFVVVPPHWSDTAFTPMANEMRKKALFACILPYVSLSIKIRQKKNAFKQNQAKYNANCSLTVHQGHVSSFDSVGGVPRSSQKH